MKTTKSRITINFSSTALLALGAFLILAGIGIERTYRIWIKSNTESCISIGVMPSSNFCADYTFFKEKSLFIFALYKIGFRQTSEDLFFSLTPADSAGNNLFFKSTKRRIAQQTLGINNYSLDEVSDDIDLWLSLSPDLYASKILRIITIKDILYAFNTKLVSSVRALNNSTPADANLIELSETAVNALKKSLAVASNVFSDVQQCTLSESDEPGVPSAQLSSSILALAQSLKNIRALDRVSSEDIGQMPCRSFVNRLNLINIG